MKNHIAKSLSVLACLTLVCVTTPGASTQDLPRVRVALIGLNQPKESAIRAAVNHALEAAFGADERIAVVELSLIQPALKGFGYDDSINMTVDEARRLGSAVGCDFFVVGKTEVISRSDREGETHEEAYAAVMLVNARSGRLAACDVVRAKGSDESAATAALIYELTTHRVHQYVDSLLKERTRKTGFQPGMESASSDEHVEEVPEVSSSRSQGFNAPEFLNRVKPEYTPEANLADVTATVDAMVVFRANGEIGAVEITRWAGFGLDESSQKAIRQLKFKPATRDGRPISVRAAVRYNFRRIAEQPSATPPPENKPPEKPVPDLRQLFRRKLPPGRDS